MDLHCKCEKFRWPPPPAGPLGCWAPSPEPSESSDRLPWHFPETGGTCPHVDVPVKTERHTYHGIQSQAGR